MPRPATRQSMSRMQRNTKFGLYDLTDLGAFERWFIHCALKYGFERSSYGFSLHINGSALWWDHEKDSTPYWIASRNPLQDLELHVFQRNQYPSYGRFFWNFLFTVKSRKYARLISIFFLRFSAYCRGFRGFRIFSFYYCHFYFFPQNFDLFSRFYGI